MARVQNTLIGKASGSVGGATFSTWKGINVLKSKAISVANPKTIKQQYQRSRLSVMVAVYRLIAQSVTLGFKSLATGKSEYNAFISANIQDATIPFSTTVAIIDYALLKLAKGIIGITPITASSATNGTTNLTVNWNSLLAPVSSSPDDQFVLTAFNATQNVWAQASGANRITGEGEVFFEENIQTGDLIQFYLFFKDVNSDNVSDSVFGSLTAA